MSNQHDTEPVIYYAVCLECGIVYDQECGSAAGSECPDCGSELYESDKDGKTEFDIDGEQS